MMMCVSSVYVARGISSSRCSMVSSVPSVVAICSSMLYDVSRQGEQYSMYM